MPEMNLNPDYLLTLSVGLVATACQIAFSLSTSRLRLLLLSFGASLGFLVQYALLSQWVGFWSSVVGTSYTGLLALGYRWRFFQARAPMVAAVLGYLGVFAGLTRWSTFVLPEAIPLVAGIAVLFGLRSQNLIVTKVIFAASGLLWFTYEVYNGMFTQLIGEGFELVGNVITLLLLLRASRATTARTRELATRPLPVLDAVDAELLAVLRIGEQEFDEENLESNRGAAQLPTEPLEVAKS